MTEATVVQDAADRALAQSDFVFLGDDALQIRAALAHDAIRCDIRTSLDDLVQVLQLVFVQPSRTTTAGLVNKTARTFCVEPMNPVTVTPR